MKKIGFLSFGPLDAIVAIPDTFGCRHPSAIDRAGGCCRELGAGWRLFSRPPFRPAARLAVSSPGGGRSEDQPIEIGTAVIDMRYENPLYMAEDAGAADLIAGGGFSWDQPRFAGASDRRLALFRVTPAEDEDDGTWAGGTRRFSWRSWEVKVSRSQTHGRCFRTHRAPAPRTSFGRPARPDLVGFRLQCDRGLGGKLGMNLQSRRSRTRERRAIPHPAAPNKFEAFREAWKEAGHRRTPRVSVSRSIFALVDDRDRTYFGRDLRDQGIKLASSTRKPARFSVARMSVNPMRW